MKKSTVEIEEEDWIEYMKRSTAAAVDQMRIATIPCWIETRNRMKWRSAMRTAAMPTERWARKAAEWNPGLSTKYKTCRAVGRPKKRWEDEINDFLRMEGIEEATCNDERNNDEWIKTAKDQKGWKKMESMFARTAAAAPDTWCQRRRRTGGSVRHLPLL